MNLTSAANSILPSVSNEITCTSIPPNTESAHIDMDVNADTTVIPSTITSSGVLSKDVAIDMIQAARWWSPDLTCNPEPLSSLLSNNAKKESGWLRNLLFPSTTMNERSQYQQDLTLSYLLTFAENKGLAGEVATAWGMSLESAIKTRKATVFAAGMCYPVNKVIIEISSKGRDAMLGLLDEYPHGCLRPTWRYNSVGHIQMCMLDAALHSNGRCRHSRRIQNLFMCGASSVKSNTKTLVKNLFAGFAPEPKLPKNFHQLVDKRTGRMFWYNALTKTGQWTRPGLPSLSATTPTTAMPSEPSPTSVTEVPATAKANATGNGGVSTSTITGNQAVAINKPSDGVSSTKRMPFGNKANAGGIVNGNTNIIPLKGKPTELLKSGTNAIQAANLNKPRTSIVFPNHEMESENVSQQHV